jgi:hypothetical protein
MLIASNARSPKGFPMQGDAAVEDEQRLQTASYF